MKHNAGLPTKLKFGPLELEGFAISALASYIMVPLYKACFDLGHCPVEAISFDNVFLSHVHKDHMAGLPLYFSLRVMQKMGPAKVYCPAVSREPLLNMLRAFDAMEGPVVYDHSGEIVGVNPGDLLDLGRNKVRVFGVQHRVDSVGYTIVEQRSKLKPEFVGLTTKEIQTAKLKGVGITETTSKDMFTYVGDSTVDTLRNHPELGDSEVLMLESTYLQDHPVDKAVKYGHTHIQELVDLFTEDHPVMRAKHIVLKHFSARYERDMVLEAMQSLPSGLRERVTPLI